jgi:hypothetical protein
VSTVRIMLRRSVWIVLIYIPAMLPQNKTTTVIALVAMALSCHLPLHAASDAAADNAIPARLDAIEALLSQVANALKPPVAGVPKTRLLIPFVSNQAGFDTGISIVNTGRDSTGIIGKAGRCTFHFFGTVAGAPHVSSQTTSVDIPVGGSVVFTVSSGGTAGIVAVPNFQGYVEVVCDFPFAHGYSFLTDGPIGQAKVGASTPVLVLPLVRTSALEESLGR